MKELDFWLPDWESAKKVFDFYSVESNCFAAWGKLKICPHYVVAMGSDMISAYYAAYIAELARKQCHIMPRILCVGGLGKLSKYTNRLDDGTVLSDGHMLWWVIRQLGNYPITILDRANSTSENLKEIADYLAYKNEQNAELIICLPKRISKRVELANASLPIQFIGTRKLNAYYYVPGETMEEMCCLYNGKAVAGGLPLLTEAADLFNRMSVYDGMHFNMHGKSANKDLLIAGETLMHRYPLNISHCLLSAPLQFCKIRFGLMWHQKEIAADLRKKILEWQCYV